jgi:DMSO/TMAO reductase YedYZ molybdopterin-dependent catalytic subunit
MPIDRRRFLELSALATLAPRAVVAANTRRASMVQMNGYAVNAETPLDLSTDYLTPNRLFFVRSYWVPHPPDVHGWTLSVNGDVTTAMQLTGSDLRRMPVTEVTLMVCGPALAGQAG